MSELGEPSEVDDQDSIWNRAHPSLLDVDIVKKETTEKGFYQLPIDTSVIVEIESEQFPDEFFPVGEAALESSLNGAVVYFEPKNHPNLPEKTFMTTFEPISKDLISFEREAWQRAQNRITPGQEGDEVALNDKEKEQIASMRKLLAQQFIKGRENLLDHYGFPTESITRVRLTTGISGWPYSRNK